MCAAKSVGKYVMDLCREGPRHRFFYSIYVKRLLPAEKDELVAQVGSIDPFLNENDEHIVAIDCERLNEWLCKDVRCTPRLAKLFALAGILPLHPEQFMTARANRIKAQSTDPDTDELSPSKQEQEAPPSSP